MSSNDFTTTRVYVFDLDGVLFRGEDPIDGAAESVARLRARPDARLFFLTNNSTQTRTFYRDKLTRLGMPCDENEIVTSASAAGMYLTAQGAAGKTALVVGGVGIKEELTRAGLILVTDDVAPTAVSADYVVVGMDRQFQYATLWRAQQAILRGATFIATNRDGQFPVENGQVTPGGGAMVAALETCTEVVPLVIGKPETLGLRTILDVAGVRPEEALMIGDRLDTDILCGNRLGVPTALVLTGVTSAEKAAAAPPEMTPTFVLNDLRELE